MTIFRKDILYDAPDRQKQKLLVLRSDKGAITLEYVMTMAVAGILMTGVALLFNNMSIQIINSIKSIAMSFPNI